MRNRRSHVASITLLAVLIATPALAGWEDPDVNGPSQEYGVEELVVVAQWGFQIAQVAL